MAGIRERYELITSVDAASILGDRNQRNRPVSVGHVKWLAGLMTSGQFDATLSGPIRFYEDGNLADGQHRLAAMVKAHKDYTFLVQQGLTAKQGMALDVGKRRSSVDRLTIRGVEHPKYLAAIARAAIEGTGSGAIRAEFSSAAEVEETVVANEARLREWVTVARHTNAVMAAVFMLACDTHAEIRVRAIADRVINHELNGRLDPATHIRLMLDDKLALRGGMGARRPYFGRVAACLKAALEGRELRVVRVLESWPATLPVVKP